MQKGFIYFFTLARVIVLLLIGVCLYLMTYSKKCLSIKEDGLSLARPFGKRLTLKWDQLRSIKLSRDQKYKSLNHLEISTKTGKVYRYKSSSWISDPLNLERDLGDFKQAHLFEFESK